MNQFTHVQAIVHVYYLFYLALKYVKIVSWTLELFTYVTNYIVKHLGL